MDEYLEIPLDMSKCIFIFTANNLNDINPILINRLTQINL